jgi:hypothetical protein
MPSFIHGSRGRLPAEGLTTIAAVVFAASGIVSLAEHPPEPPRSRVDVTMPAVTGRVLHVSRDGDLQEALRRAQPGDLVSIEAGAELAGPFVLPRKSGAGWIVVATSALENGFPPGGSRVSPTDAASMPRLVSRSGSVLVAEKGSHNFRFIGIEMCPAAGAALTNVIDLGSGARSLEEVPHDFIFDRCYIHGDPARGSRRGIALNAAATAVVGSLFTDFKEVGADSQAICGWAGPGPYRIENNEIEAAGENIMFGGADPRISGLVPSDIEIRRNRITKPLALKADGPGSSAAPWTVKNLLEIKNGRRLLIEGNVFETTWAAAQSGFAILFTVRNEEGTAPWSVVEDVSFSRNVVRHAGSGINVLGHDDVGGPSGRTRRISIRDNVFLDLGGPRWGGAGTFVQLLDGTADVVIERNTAFQSGPIVVADGAPHEGFVFRDNVALHNADGIVGSGASPGRDTLAAYFPGADVSGNTIVGGPAAQYPRANEFPRSIDRDSYLRSPGPRRSAAAGADLKELLQALGPGVSIP